jgi:hypothetical protein
MAKYSLVASKGDFGIGLPTVRRAYEVVLKGWKCVWRIADLVTTDGQPAPPQGVVLVASVGNYNVGLCSVMRDCILSVNAGRIDWRIADIVITDDGSPPQSFKVTLDGAGYILCIADIVTTDGEPIPPPQGVALVASVGGYDVGLCHVMRDYILAIDVGHIDWSIADIVLIDDSIPSKDYSLMIDAGSYSLVGISAILTRQPKPRDWRIYTLRGSYFMVGNRVRFRRRRYR